MGALSPLSKLHHRFRQKCESQEEVTGLCSKTTTAETAKSYLKNLVGYMGV
jgi:hypothetical protein